MHIGYLKFTMNMEIDFTTAKMGNAEGRITLFKSIIDAGWKLTLYSQVTTDNEELLYSTDLSNKDGINNKWIKSINYKPDKLIEEDINLLIIENGPDNLLFKTRYNKQPFIRRCAEIMNSYSGLVFIFNIHPDVPFPLEKMAYCDVQYSDKNNVYRKNKGSHPDHGWASYDEICKDKKLIFFNQAHNQEKYLDFFDRRRQGYRKRGVTFYQLPILYGSWLIPKYIKKRGLKKQPNYDFVYLGYPRYREKEFSDFLFPLINKFDIHCWGPWDKKSNLKFKNECLNLGFKIHGFLPSFVMCPKTYHKSYASLGLISKKLQECGWVTHRTLETIHSRCILFGIDQATGIRDYLDEEFLVSNSKQLGSWLKKLKSISYKKRKQIWEQQYEKIKKYDGRNMIKHLMKIYRKEK